MRHTFTWVRPVTDQNHPFHLKCEPDVRKFEHVTGQYDMSDMYLTAICTSDVHHFENISCRVASVGEKMCFCLPFCKLDCEYDEN